MKVKWRMKGALNWKESAHRNEGRGIEVRPTLFEV